MVLTPKESAIGCVLVATLTLTAFGAGWACHRRPVVKATTIATDRIATSATAAYVGVSSRTTSRQIEYRTTTEWLRDGTVKQTREAQTTAATTAVATVHETESRTAVTTSETRTTIEPVATRPAWLFGASVRADADLLAGRPAFNLSLDRRVLGPLYLEVSVSKPLGVFLGARVAF